MITSNQYDRQEREMGTKIVKKRKHHRKRSIFGSIFVPLICLMIIQSAIYYTAAVYGGIKDSLNQNAADILKERLTNRKNELETFFTNDWIDMRAYEEAIGEIYDTYQETYGEQPFVDSKEVQVGFLEDASSHLIQMLRDNQTNGVFLILNDQSQQKDFDKTEMETKYGLDIRDMDATSAYTATDDLLLTRAPSALVDKLGCSLDSWWEASYTFDTREAGDFYYEPIAAAYENPGVKGEDIAYFSSAHHLSGSDTTVVSYSIPMMDSQGYPYGVLGVELATKYLATLLPSSEINEGDESCYILAMRNQNSTDCIPIATNGSTYQRCFSSNETISCAATADTGGFTVKGRGGVALYGDLEEIEIYNNNNPFEEEQLVLIAFTEEKSLFYYSRKVERTLFIVTQIALALGVMGIFGVSHKFASPITALAQKAKSMDAHSEYHLDHLGIAEIDQLVDSIEELNVNVSKEVARTEFFSRMSHDMRTPMNAIISFSSREMLDGTDEKQRNEYLDKIHSSGEYLLGLINEVLDMTKIESNKVDLHYDVIQASELCDMVIPMVEKLAQKKQIQFSHTLQLPGKQFLKVDTQHLNQIMLNLLSNAVKFTPDGGVVKLEVELLPEETDLEQLYCQIRVTDTGMGISKEFMEKLYTPFEQEHQGQGGTGLGLSISRKLIELMDGSIQCSSTPNIGTQFLVNLRFAKSAKPEPEAKENIIEIEGRQISDEILCGKRVLICEDHPLNTQIAKRLLERKGMIADCAEDGQQGLLMYELSEEYSYDAILMDIRMPVMDGLEAAEAIRALVRQDARTIPIIAMTANAFEEDIRKSHSVGMNEHLSKPIEPDKLYATLTKHIALHTIKPSNQME